MQAQVQSVIVEGILQLRLSLPQLALASAVSLADQSPVAVQHMTLVRLDDLGVEVPPALLPEPPCVIDLESGVRLVDTGVKRSCYLVATEGMQCILREYSQRCAAVLGLDDSAVDPTRVFHVTVSNAGGGDVRASVGSPWEFPSQIL